MAAVTAYTYRCLGRPLPPLVLQNPLVVEAVAALLAKPILDGSPVVRISSEATSEAPLLAALATVASRMRRSGSTVTACGEVFRDVNVPPRPFTRVAILLEAPFYENLDAWLEPHHDQTVFLIGHELDWRRIGTAPDLVVPRVPALGLAPLARRWRDALADGSPGIIEAALGCDMSTPGPGLFEVHLASTLTGSGWYSPGMGTWLAKEELRNLAAVDPVLRKRIRDNVRAGGRLARAVSIWEELWNNTGS